MELPMNLLMKRLGANITLPLMVTLWGVVCACQGDQPLRDVILSASSSIYSQVL